MLTNSFANFFNIYVERKEKYRNVLHQNDVWHGGKNIAKKINAVSIYNALNYIVSLFCFSQTIVKDWNYSC